MTMTAREPNAIETPAEKSGELATRYRVALQDYLLHRDEMSLQQAYQLGRLGLANGNGIVELAAVHHEALTHVLTCMGDREGAETVRAAAGFLVETLSSFEMTHRGFRESAIALRQVNERLEVEIKRIAHALHDEAGQLLASIHLSLNQLETELTPAGLAHLRKVCGLLTDIEMHLRRLSHEMRPTALDDLGLLPALQFLAKGVSARAAIAVTVEGSPGPLPFVVETAIYRVVQEGLTNATRHAKASRISIRFWREGHMLRCTLQDNGSGFDVATVLARRGADRGFGLAGMQERVAALGGTFHIRSSPGNGTELDIAIPSEASHVPTTAAR